MHSVWLNVSRVPGGQGRHQARARRRQRVLWGAGVEWSQNGSRPAAGPAGHPHGRGQSARVRGEE